MPSWRLYRIAHPVLGPIVKAPNKITGRALRWNALKLPVAVALLHLTEDFVRAIDRADEGAGGAGSGRGGGCRVGAWAVTERGGFHSGDFVNDGRDWTVTREIEINSEHNDEKSDYTHIQ